MNNAQRLCIDRDVKHRRRWQDKEPPAIWPAIVMAVVLSGGLLWALHNATP